MGGTSGEIGWGRTGTSGEMGEGGRTGTSGEMGEGGRTGSGGQDFGRDWNSGEIMWDKIG